MRLLICVGRTLPGPETVERWPARSPGGELLRKAIGEGAHDGRIDDSFTMIAATGRVTTPSVGGCGVLKTNPQERLPAKATVRGSAHVEAEETCSYLCKLFFSASPEQYVSIQQRRQRRVL